MEEFYIGEFVRTARDQPQIAEDIACSLDESWKRCLAFSAIGYIARSPFKRKKWLQLSMKEAMMGKDPYCRATSASWPLYVMAIRKMPVIYDFVVPLLDDLKNEPSFISQAAGCESILRAVFPDGEETIDRVLKDFESAATSIRTSKRNWYLRNVARGIVLRFPDKAQRLANRIDRPISRENCLKLLREEKYPRFRRFIEDFINTHAR